MKDTVKQILAGVIVVGLGYYLFQKKKEEEKLPSVPQAPTTPTTPTTPTIPTTPTTAPSGYFVYNLQKGETLWGVAEKFLGDGSRWKEIIVARYGRPVNEDEAKTLQVGETLYVPQAGGVSGVQSQQKPLSDAEIKLQIVNDIEAQKSYYFAYNPPWFRENLINSLVAKYGEQYRQYISDKVYTILTDIKTIGYIDNQGNFVAYQTQPTSSSQSPNVLPTQPTSPPSPPVSTYPRTVTAQSWGARFRSAPYLSAQLVGSVAGGTKFTVIGVVTGDTYEGENRWWKLPDGTYTWVGNTLEKP